LQSHCDTVENNFHNPTAITFAFVFFALPLLFAFALL
jgi:hypothetical protein